MITVDPIMYTVFSFTLPLSLSVGFFFLNDNDIVTIGGIFSHSDEVYDLSGIATCIEGRRRAGG
jgi:hypothetical protein